MGLGQFHIEYLRVKEGWVSGQLGKPAINLNRYLFQYGDPFPYTQVDELLKGVVCQHCRVRGDAYRGERFWALGLARTKTTLNPLHLCIPILTEQKILWGVCLCWESPQPETHDFYLLTPNLKVLLALHLIPFPLWQPQHAGPDHTFLSPLSALTLLAHDWDVFVSPVPPTFESVEEGACLTILQSQKHLRGQPLFWDDLPNTLNILLGGDQLVRSIP
jgi:hypothetical protein